MRESCGFFFSFQVFLTSFFAPFYLNLLHFIFSSTFSFPKQVLFSVWLIDPFSSSLSLYHREKPKLCFFPFGFGRGIVLRDSLSGLDQTLFLSFHFLSGIFLSFSFSGFQSPRVFNTLRVTLTVQKGIKK